MRPTPKFAVDLHRYNLNNETCTLNTPFWGLKSIKDQEHSLVRSNAHPKEKKKGEKMMKNIFALISILFLLFLCSSVSFGEERLLQSVTQGNEMSVKTLLTTGAEVDTRDEIGKTPLIIAADKGYLPIVQLLIQNGADVNAQNNLRWTALMFAAGAGHFAITK